MKGMSPAVPGAVPDSSSRGAFPPMIRRKLINRDAMNSASRTAVATAMVTIFDRLQGLKNEVQLLAIAGAMALLSEVVEMPPQEFMPAVYNLMKDPETCTRRELRFQAMEFHLKDELTKGMR